MRRHYLRLLKNSTCDDGDAWVSEHLEPLKRLTGPESTQAFHKVWNNLVRRGRPTAAGSGRYFDATARRTAPSAMFDMYVYSHIFHKFLDFFLNTHLLKK
eukprot:COSAG01_NODE_22833_length_839_cov_1.633784_2_plen_100_part_00